MHNIIKDWDRIETLEDETWFEIWIETWEDEIPANAYFASSTLFAGSETKLSPEKDDGE